MSLELGFAERRVLGALIEKGFTTPEQYPLSLNAVVVASNQSSRRDPISSTTEEMALDSLESLRKKGLATLVRMEGSRVDRWKHRFGDTLGLGAKEIAILAELLLRGPQTDGEIRSRASRMVPCQDLDEVTRVIESLRTRPEPLIRRITPAGRKRGVKYAHAFYPVAERPEDDGESGGDREEVPAPEPVEGSARRAAYEGPGPADGPGESSGVFRPGPPMEAPPPAAGPGPSAARSRDAGP